MENHCKFITDTYTIEGNDKIYDFNKCLSYIHYHGKAQYGQSFKINEVDCPIFYKLLIYMIKDKSEAAKLQIDLSKGILLSGPIGCGKTSIMHLIRPFAIPATDYKIKTCREISFEFAKRGYEALQPYTQKLNNNSRLHGYCFDDVGAEQQIKHFGNDCNVMAEILISRYEHFIDNKSITHITSNLSASEIETIYGNRIRSRLRNMLNLIAFDKETKDKR
ncbi:ATPase [Flavobacterium sp.]|uniref:ATPase n=1 Tax=Flavobacterium sp. TaxID=239 RepID=UPI0024884AE9|nr:ATPase [Flavobacterium sp.]MDI1317449.1 ATPase [Flavobacterium sp.]